ncbi:arylsulfatase [Echinicola rosea]|uniref:Arylsulfatase n=1 Tax=Echinicola rosea TaxID=1807691 RepID=A0ABQ1UYJ1_9BACT|nr:arylsulfatase [Echinicola rosea]GGF28915.1 arylsulfatase [Echinicola rosea]
MDAQKYALVLILSFFSLLLHSCENAATSVEGPNIILIYADDLGKGMLSHEGQKHLTTPNIDRLAAEGMRFTHATGSMLCAPARASLITGLHDCHAPGFPITNGQMYKHIGDSAHTLQQVEEMINTVLDPIPDAQVFLGQVAQEAGYVTGQFGKLEWGFSASDYQMKRHGWNQYFGYLDHNRAHGFYPPYLFENGQLVNIPGNTREDCGKTIERETQKAFEDRWDMTGKAVYSQDLFMDMVLTFIRDHKNQPFFLYFPTQLPHGPVAVPSVHPEVAASTALTQIEKEYASMVKMLDDNIGQILEELDRLQIAENTLVIFTADNGHEIYYTQEGRVLKPYTNMQTGERFDNLEDKYYSDLAGDIFNGNNGRAGMKRSNLQGGLEVPLVVRWPGKITAGSTSDLLVTNYDWLPTVAEIVGFQGDLATDGVSFLPEMIDKGQTQEHDFIVHSSFEGPTLIAKDGWKLRYFIQKDVFELYYLPDDYREAEDLSAKYPQKRKEMKALLLESCDGNFENGWYRPAVNQLDVASKWRSMH